MKVAVLTSSRADYGIYLPLLKALQKDPFFDLKLIVFGTHLSPLHGNTIDVIRKDGFTIDHEVDHVPQGDTERAVATSMATAATKFVPVWDQEKENYDLVFCLGDRFEMFAAVSVAVPFNIRFAHLHGGETTAGAIDNEFRHCLTLFSRLHFVSTAAYAKRVAEIKGSSDHIYITGALSLQNLSDTPVLSVEAFQKEFGIDISKPSLLVTFHPETVDPAANKRHVEEVIAALKHFDNYQVIITMPNADTMGDRLRQAYTQFAKERLNVILVENFGTAGYFSCMKWSRLVIGNSSSGIIEAASFEKYVIDIGRRQEGRAVSPNVIHVEADRDAISAAIKKGLAMGKYEGENIYYQKNTVQSIIEVLKLWEP